MNSPWRGIIPCKPLLQERDTIKCRHDLNLDSVLCYVCCHFHILEYC